MQQEPATIRARLVLLVVAVFIPSLAAAVWGIVIQYERERDAIERSLRETARALSLVVDRELGKREIIGRMLAESPALDARDFPAFYEQARKATQGLGGWVVLADPDQQIVNTALPYGAPLAQRRPDEPRRFPFVTGAPIATDLAVGRVTGHFAASIQVPVTRGDATPYNVGVTIRPEELQQVLKDQRGPPGWISAILDRRGAVIAREPDVETSIGRIAQPEFVATLRRKSEGSVAMTTRDGVAIDAFYSTSPIYGWTFVMGVPENVLARGIGQSVLEIAGVALALLAASVALAIGFGRRVSAPIKSLHSAAQRLARGEPVQAQATGIRECDEVSVALAQASERITGAAEELERRVAYAIAATENAQAQLAAAQRLEALGRLTGGVAHDFNNLLAVIGNNLFLLQRRAATDGATERELAAIRRAVDGGVRLTRQLLAFSRRQPLHPQVLDPAEHLPSLSDFLVSCLGTSIELVFDIAPDVRCIEVDPAELELALLNLAMNSNDAMPGGGRLTLRARNAGADDIEEGEGRFVLIEVEDTGGGIAPDLVERVFEPFFTTKPVGEGTGLGLSQVYGFCKQAGGIARVASPVGAGATVSMWLPAARAVVRAPGRESVTTAKRRAQGERVLVVDDNAELVAATVSLLQAFGYDVTTARSADDALRMALGAGSAIDIVLTDINMPGSLNGLDLARKLREQRPDLPVVLMTGYTGEYERALADGYTVLRKPCDPQALHDVLQQASAIS